LIAFFHHQVNISVDSGILADCFIDYNNAQYIVGSALCRIDGKSGIEATFGRYHFDVALHEYAERIDGDRVEVEIIQRSIAKLRQG